jgi:DNA mismatch repair protein MutS
MPKHAVSPVRQQYLSIKRSYPDAILFFRLGDFYETFDEDARIVARELDIVLTSRNIAKGHRVPMAGVPCHAAEAYIAKLVKNGYRVAICEQVGSDAVDGLMPREVVRVATPGTVTESDLLEDKRSNYLAAMLTENQQAALSYVDVTTGEFATTQIPSPQAVERLSREIERLQPAECLVQESSQWTTRADRALRGHHAGRLRMRGSAPSHKGGRGDRPVPS